MINEAKIEKPDARSQGCARGANAPTHRGPSSTKIVKKKCGLAAGMTSGTFMRIYMY